MNHDTRQAASPDDESFLRRAREELDRSCDALDGYTLSRLNQIRHRALERKRRLPARVLLPFGGFITACVLVLAVSLNERSAVTGDDSLNTSPLEDIEILSATESLELFEDYEFYQWLAENETSV